MFTLEEIKGIIIQREDVDSLLDILDIDIETAVMLFSDQIEDKLDKLNDLYEDKSIDEMYEGRE